MGALSVSPPSRSPSPCRHGDLEAHPESDYDVMLLDDHPLRSYPTECIPGLSVYMEQWYTAARKSASERIFRSACVLLVILYVNLSHLLSALG
jgi:hypothetical protein